jgi:serine phosphatase RsbU (regulator of sigma subunit)/anti-sigma regulatory factor (Ser/Thr protein kinase)
MNARSSPPSRRLGRRRPPRSDAPEPVPGAGAPDFDIDPHDPLLAYFQQSPGPVELDKLRLESRALDAMRAAGVKLAVPLVSQGELIGVLNLGPRLSEQDYSADDRKLLDNLASQAAPALRVAQLVREQEAEIRTREKYEQELRIAHLIQQNFLPREAPELAGWTPQAFYRSAREVGGDFYDFIDLSGTDLSRAGGDARMGIVIGDVTDKGVPAALMMASTRSVIRSVALRGGPPGLVLEEVNDLLCPDMPPKMFVTCLYAILEPHSGHLVYANAGHNVPYRRMSNCVDELKARGMPLGLLPGSQYEEKEVTIAAGEIVLFSSDGIAEAHNADGEMFGCPRIVSVVERYDGKIDMRDAILDELDRFTGADWEQEDDITMVTLERAPAVPEDFEAPVLGADAAGAAITNEISLDFTIPSAPGNERLAMQRVADAITVLQLDATRLERVKTAVAEATMNAIEHGNNNDPDLPVAIELSATSDELRIRITDHGGGAEIPAETAPDLDLKLAGEQTPRGWGLFLIKNMVDEMHVTSDDVHHTVELVVHLSGGRS